MNQRLTAAIVALGLAVALVIYAAVARVPYATEGTGHTINVLGDTAGKPIISVSGHRTYPDDGDLRMTYVTVSPASKAGTNDGWLSLGGALAAWIDPDQAVLPYADIYPAGTNAQQSQQQGVEEMNTSQDDAIAVALRATGVKVPQVVKVAQVTPKAPADGVLETGDVVTAIDGHPLAGRAGSAPITQQLKTLHRLIGPTAPGATVRMTVLRGGDTHTYKLTTEKVDGRNIVGFAPGVGFHFPFDVSISIGNIGGPSAGLMFSLAVYDYLTPGSLTGGHVIAGTGTIDPSGAVGAIGGVRQKVITARKEGVQLYFVPTLNCADALGVDAGSMRIVRATTFTQARQDIAAWVADPQAKLPSCQDAAA